MGRHTKRTPEVERVLTEALRVGTPIAAACQYARISLPTYYRWIEASEEFRELIDHAQGEAIVRNLALIQTAAKEDWRAAVAALKLSFPQHFDIQRIEQDTTLHIDGEEARQQLDALLGRAKVRVIDAGSGETG